MWIEPARDWNILVFISFRSPDWSVNWTCEGLKQSPVIENFKFLDSCELNLWGIETKTSEAVAKGHASVNWTCEGLKRFLLNRRFLLLHWCELNLWGIETLPLLGLFSWAIQVWIEPVRDWNVWTCRFFSSNLQGVNWTCEGLKHPVFRGGFGLLPQCELNLWGIETFYLCLSPLLFFFVWIEPVRDWNLNVELDILMLVHSVNWTCEGLKH